MNIAAAVVVFVLTVTTQNVKSGLPPPAVHHDINQAASSSSILFTQEMGGRNARRFAPEGWDTAHFGGNSRGDCATYWDRKVWRASASWVYRVTHAPFRAGTRYALITVLHKIGNPTVLLAAVCVHMITKTLARRAVYRRGIDRLHAMLVRLERFPYVVVGGDWNRDWHQRVRMRGFHSAEPPRVTKDHRKVDYFWWYPQFIDSHGITVIGHTRSDHNGVRMNLDLRETTMRR